MSFLNIQESINFAPKAIQPQLQAITPLFQDKSDFYADKNWNKGTSQPWKILITGDNFDSLVKKKLEKSSSTKKYESKGKTEGCYRSFYWKLQNIIC